jgi:predicted metal-binding membrane protein
LALGFFLLAYFGVWTAFALAAFSGDMALHRVADLWPAIAGHPQITAATLGAAAVYQLTPLKEACLRACRHPAMYLMHHYRRGPLGGWKLGFGHALFCVGCCWALMLIMFAVGVAHLAWMGILAIVTLVEKATPAGARLVWPIGAALAALALVELLRPGAVPGL